MNILNKNPLTLLGLFILIVSIPVTVYLVQRQQIFQSRAATSTTGGINGTVRQLPDNALLPGVTVSLVGTAKTVDTSATGSWAMTDIPSGSRQFTFSKTGFVSKTETVTIPVGRSVSLHIQLAPVPMGYVQGVIKRLPDNAPVAGATVSVAGLTTVTKDNGEFRIDNVPSGSQTVTATKAGYIPASQTVTVPSGGHGVNANSIQLKPESPPPPTPTPSPSPPSTPPPICEHPAPPPGCHWEGPDVYPTCDVKLVCPTPIPVTVTSVTFNGSDLGIISGKNTITTTLRPTGTPSQEIIPVVVNYSQGNPSTRYIKFIYQPPATPTDNTKIYVDPNPVDLSTSTTVTATGTTGCSTYISNNFGAGLTDCTLAGGFTCSQPNPKNDGNPCWWKWACRSGTPGSYNATFNAAGTNCASSRQYTVNSATGYVQGVIFSLPVNAPVPGATVSVVGLTTVTDAKGVFRINNVPSGVRTVTATKAGYFPASQTVTVPSGGHGVNANSIQLKPESPPPPTPTSTPTPSSSPTPTPTPTPSRVVTGVIFNGTTLDITGRTTTSIRLTQNQNNQILVPVNVTHNIGLPRNIAIKFIYQPLVSPTPTPTPPSSVVSCDGNNDQIKINNAINLLTNGGIVILPARQCNLNASIRISKDNVVLTGQGTSSVLFLANNANSDVITAAGRNNIYIRNLKINGNKANQTPQNERGLGIKLENVSRGSIEDVFIQDTGWHGIGLFNTQISNNPEFIIRRVRVQDAGLRRNGGFGGGIVVEYSPQNITLEDNTIVNSLKDGILVRIRTGGTGGGAARDIRIQRNTIQNPQGNGITIGCESGSLNTLWILNNTVSGMHDTRDPFGIWIAMGRPGSPCDDTQKYIQNNRVLPNGPGITGPYGDHFGLGGNNGVLTGNYSEGSYHDGYALGNIGLTESNWIIKDNRAVNNGIDGGQGFMLLGIKNSLIANNLASGNSQDGIRLAESLNNRVENNTVRNNEWVEIIERGQGDYNTFICNNVEYNDIRLVGSHSRILPCASPTSSSTAIQQQYDLNGDKVVNSVDSGLFFNEWRKRIKGGNSTTGDFNNDGVINSIDYSMLSNQINY